TVPITCIRTSTTMVRRWMRWAVGSGVVVAAVVDRLVKRNPSLSAVVSHCVPGAGEGRGSARRLQDGAEPHLAVAEPLHGLRSIGQWHPSGHRADPGDQGE